MNIVLVNEYAGYLGGVEQYIAHVASALRQRGHTCHLFYSKTSRDTENYLALFESSHHIHTETDLRGLVDSLQADLLYLHRLSSVESFLSLPVPKVRMIHDHDLCCPRRHKYHLVSSKPCRHPVGWRCWADLAFLQRQSGRISWRSLREHRQELRRNHRLDRLLVGSSAMRWELLINGFSPEQVTVIPPAVPSPGTRETAAPSIPTILFIGQMIRGKGPDLLLQALSRIQGNFRALMVGHGNMLPKLQKLARRLRLEQRVEWLGWVSPEKLGELYSQARVVAVPSRWPEPFGMVGLEAMHHRKPVVAFEVGGIPDWLEDGVTGYLVRPPSVSHFSERLHQLLNCPALAMEMGTAGYAKAHRDFRFESTVTHLEQTLLQLTPQGVQAV